MATEQEADHGRFTITRSQRGRIARFVRKFRSNTKAMLDFSTVVLLILVAIFASVIAPYPINATNIGDRSQVPSVEYPFGTDDLDRGIFSRVVMGNRISLYVGFRAISGALAVGAVVDAVAGYAGGLTDETLMRVMDAAVAFPPVLLVLTLLVVLGPELSNVVIALVFVYTPYIARVSRSVALTECNEAYVEAAIAHDENDSRIVFSEVFPNCMTSMLVQGSLNVSFAILAEAGLSFPGLDAQPPRPSWRLMINTGRGFMQTAPRMLLFPALVIGIAVIGFSMLDDGLRDVLDPKVEAIE